MSMTFEQQSSESMIDFSLRVTYSLHWPAKLWPGLAAFIQWCLAWWHRARKPTFHGKRVSCIIHQGNLLLPHHGSMVFFTLQFKIQFEDIHGKYVKSMKSWLWMCINYLEILLPLDSAIVFPQRFLKDHSNPFALGKTGLAYISYGTESSVFNRHTLSDFQRHIYNK